MQFVRAFKKDISVQKRKFRFFELFNGVFPTVIKFVISDTGGIQSEVISRINHRFAFRQKTEIRTGEKISSIEIDRVGLTFFSRLTSAAMLAKPPTVWFYPPKARFAALDARVNRSCKERSVFSLERTQFETPAGQPAIK